MWAYSKALSSYPRTWLFAGGCFALITRTATPFVHVFRIQITLTRVLRGPFMASVMFVDTACVCSEKGPLRSERGHVRCIQRRRLAVPGPGFLMVVASLFAFAFFLLSATTLCMSVCLCVYLSVCLSLCIYFLCLSISLSL